MHNHYFETVRLLVDAAPFVFTPNCFALKVALRSIVCRGYATAVR